MIIAIDGHSAAGKGTLARRLAEEFDLAHLDTGSLYRAVALQMIHREEPPSDRSAAESAANNLTIEALADPDCRLETVGQAASVVAQVPAVREALLRFQRDFAATPPGDKKGAVIDGRDIGTVVCPEADLKLFVTASDTVRAERRFLELQGRGESPDLDKILQDIRARDQRDETRNLSPLRQADDALLLDTTNLDIEAAFQEAKALVHSRLKI